MDNAGYTTLNRQSGLMHEMQVVANNIANLSTTGFRKEGVIFAEHLLDAGPDEPTLSMASDEARDINLSQGALQQTKGAFDLAIEGSGFFEIATPKGNQLTRAGNFGLSPEGELVTADGFPVLDSGESPISIPTDVGPISIARDGTISAGGVPISEVGIFSPEDPNDLVHEGGTRFSTKGVTAGSDTGAVYQGFLESSNVNAVSEITRMIEVQRAYELGQNFLDTEDSRIRSVVQTLGR